MTYRAREPWLPEEVLITEMTLGDRIKYVRENLVDERGKVMTQPTLAELTGLKPGQHGIIRWEKHGTEPGERARKVISDLTGATYRPGLFARREAEVLVKEMFGIRLQAHEVRLEKAETLLDRVVAALAKASIELPESADSPRSAPIARRRGAA